MFIIRHLYVYTSFSFAFSGSSTDLTPSLLGFYDTLTNALDGGTSCVQSLITGCDNHHEQSPLNDESNTPTQSYLYKLQEYKNRVVPKTTPQQTQDVVQRNQSYSNSGSCSNSLKGSFESICSPNGTLNKHRSNIRILSANVQRIISHSDAEAVDAVNIEQLQELPRDTISQRLIKKSCTSNTNSHKFKHSNLPLSKTTGKLSQTGTDLIESLNTRLNEYIDSNRRNDLKAINSKNPSTSSICSNTHTNSKSFSFDSTNREELNNSRKFSLPKNCLKNDSFEEVVPNVSLDSSSAKEISSAIDFEEMTGNLKNMSLGAINLPTAINDQQLVDAINKPLISKYITCNTENRPLTYARSKSMAAGDFAKKNISIKRPQASISFSMIMSDMEQGVDQLSEESLDRLAEIKSKFSPKESKKLSGLQLPDIAKLKHRPLSSSSICSTSSSSSSSSGADHTIGKLNTSYLASVESLADHSENELIETHAGMTVFERACMEIVDSERNYVNDLEEVIRG